MGYSIKVWIYAICVCVHAIVIVKTIIKAPEQILEYPLFTTVMFISAIALIERINELKKRKPSLTLPTQLEIGKGNEDVCPQLDGPIKRIED